ncbi:MAG: phosphatidate cytidylyltransferase [Armatimonadota bacterium]|nr:phosphatidate cytidylyltransferase [bacterium]
MITRILSALVGIPLAVVLVFYPGGLPFAVAIGLISILGAHEFYSGVRKLKADPVEPVGLVAVAMFVVSARTYGPHTIGAIFPAVLTTLLVISFCVEIVRRKRAPLVNVGAVLFGAIYVGWLIMHLVVLRGIDGTIVVNGYKAEAGAWLVMFTFLGTWACDTGAYFVGRFCGKTPMAPHLSPHKTIEGAVGGFVGAVVLSMIVGWWIIHLPWYHALALGVIFGGLCQLGDLSESAIKREIGIKDFGNVIPGHGGILDRFDSLLFTGPAMYYYVVLFLGHWIK